ncbi:hypothetical protein C1645_421732 [Glomus cerebriforme]|uniref:AAA-ATPase-like domain-containing protein n=1 Tax=Glomus cerebriforme TaxID=658196 RepID=A0A397SHF8_9GLOM|nr:hypothetical protein C1645_421732 [Glomus cerebriforme]
MVLFLRLNYEITKDALLDLSKYLKDYHKSKCIVLIDEYDHPLDIAYRYQYYEKARGFFASLFGALLKGNDENLKKVLLVGVSRVAKSGYLSGLNNLDVFPMHDLEYANEFGFTEDEISILFQYYNKVDQLEEVKKWYDGYKAGNGIHLYNPWSINKFIRTNILKAYWIDTGGTATIRKLLWRSSDNFQDKVARLLKNDTINANVMEDLDYSLLSQHGDNALWTLLYYAGYLTMDNPTRNFVLSIPNNEVFTE